MKLLEQSYHKVQLGREKVIAFGSQSLGKSERNYCATDRELLALKYFVQYYKHYLLWEEIHSEGRS